MKSPKFWIVHLDCMSSARYGPGVKMNNPAPHIAPRDPHPIAIKSELQR